MASSTPSTSPTSASTFSFATTSTSGSHYTSESQPDLGAGFRTVLRELTYLQPPPRIPTYDHYSAQTQSLSQTEDGRRSTVWAYEPIAQYLDPDEAETETDTDTARSVNIETETEIEPSSTASPTASTSLVDDYTLTLRTQPSPPVSPGFEFDFEQNEREDGPSLGYLDQALSFIAAERAQHAARTSAQSDAWRHVVDTNRKRRKRKPKSTSLLIEDDDDGHTIDEDDVEGDDEHFPYHLESEYTKYQSKSTPLTPRPRSPLSPRASPTSGTPTPLPLQIQVQTTHILSSSDSPFTSTSASTSKRPTRKRTRPKHRKVSVTSSSTHTHTLTHARSVPSLHSLRMQHENDKNTERDKGGVNGADEHTKRLVVLARYLTRIFPAEKELLEGVERKMVVQALRRARAGVGVPKANGHGAKGEEERDGDGEDEEKEDGEDVLDPRGRTPRESDPPVHVFVDHSNILFGLLTYLKKHPHLANGNVDQGVYANAKSNFNLGLDNGNTTTATTVTKEKTKEKKEKKEEKGPVIPKILTRPTTTTTTTTNMTTNLTSTAHIPISSTTNPTSTVPLIPTTGTSLTPTSPSDTQAQTKTQTHTRQPTAHTTPIPLPSFATALSRSYPTSNPAYAYTKPTLTSSTKTRTRSRSRKARKAAQHATTAVMSSSDDVVIFPGYGEGQRERGQQRVSLRSQRDGGVRCAADEADEGEADVEEGGPVGRTEDVEEPEFEGEGEREEPRPGQGKDDDEEDEKTQIRIEKKGSQRKKHRHLSHTALALILERGRAVGRRVVVTSSPLYQPMDTLERLGYEVRVYIRVPDLGDGMDRAAKSLKKSQGHKRHLSGGTTSGGDGSGSSGTSPLKSTSSAHLTSSSAAATTTTTAAVYQTQSPTQSTQSTVSTLTSTGLATPPARVRYREQGVDELLQLKLHQALAATDIVPPGATIVLATGDGNVGQFNEDGFLGPVRTALKRGWRVELYAWEEGLSRAWSREFGLGSEWARNGMFQIIRMEQFVASLVKGGL